MQINDISKEMFIAWKNDPVTLAVIKGTAEKRLNVMEAIANAGILEAEKIQQAIGYCIGLNEMSHIEFQEENTDENASSGMESASQA